MDHVAVVDSSLGNDPFLSAQEFIKIRPGTTYRSLERAASEGRIRDRGKRKGRRFSLRDFDAMMNGRDTPPPPSFTDHGVEWVLPPFDRETVKRWHEDGCPPLGGKPLPIKKHHYRPGNRRAVATYIQAAHRKIILDSRGVKDPSTPRDPKRLNYAEAESKFGFKKPFLDRWSKKWHPEGGKPHVSLGVWIDCGGERPSLSDRTSKKEHWFWADHLQLLYDNLKAGRTPKESSAKKLLTITLDEIVDLGIPRGTASNWPNYCAYLSDRKGKLERLPSPRLDCVGRVVPNAVEFPREDALLAVERYLNGKAGVWEDDEGNEWLLQRAAVKRAKLNPSHHTALGRLVKAGIVERKRAPMWAFGSKHGNTPWVYRASDLNDVACGDRSRKVLPDGSRLRRAEPAVGLRRDVVRRLLKHAEGAHHHAKATRRQVTKGRREIRRGAGFIPSLPTPEATKALPGPTMTRPVDWEELAEALGCSSPTARKWLKGAVEQIAPKQNVVDVSKVPQYAHALRSLLAT